MKILHVSANDGHHRKATNTSKEMFHMYYMHVVLYGLQHLKELKIHLLKLIKYSN
jgi:hypothetical protein